ncbi:hypothetical protein GQ55_2G389200 [Panicum hallii var. hallii]|uniref:Secreted protein n=1 Tax=Panicum hallii var. hallii TaxID=1504633 RepID=A0A2T7EX21_9POAL|nr:hypothetical protein GQ55_2G389200 [Panicum hallii var. hallii]
MFPLSCILSCFQITSFVPCVNKVMVFTSLFDCFTGAILGQPSPLPLPLLLGIHPSSQVPQQRNDTWSDHCRQGSGKRWLQDLWFHNVQELKQHLLRCCACR